MKNYYFMNIYTGELDTPENAIKRYYSGERYAPGSESRTPSPLDSWLDEWRETNNEAPADNLSARDIQNLFAAACRI